MTLLNILLVIVTICFLFPRTLSALVSWRRAYTSYFKERYLFLFIALLTADLIVITYFIAIYKRQLWLEGR